MLEEQKPRVRAELSNAPLNNKQDANSIEV